MIVGVGGACLLICLLLPVLIYEGFLLSNSSNVEKEIQDDRR